MHLNILLKLVFCCHQQRTQKAVIFDILMTITLGINMITRQVTSFFSSTLWALSVGIFHLCILRGCLHVKFHPGMKLVLEWNHPCLWSNVSDCLHVFAEMKFHPGMKDRYKISSWDEKKKKRRVNTSYRDEILKLMC